MGAEYLLRCPSCGYEVGVSLGVGFAYPLVYRETMQSAQKGKLGATLKKFLAEHPDGVLILRSNLRGARNVANIVLSQTLPCIFPKRGLKQSRAKVAGR